MSEGQLPLFLLPFLQQGLTDSCHAPSSSHVLGLSCAPSTPSRTPVPSRTPGPPHSAHTRCHGTVSSHAGRSVSYQIPK